MPSNSVRPGRSLPIPMLVETATIQEECMSQTRRVRRTMGLDWFTAANEIYAAHTNSALFNILCSSAAVPKPHGMATLS